MADRDVQGVTERPEWTPPAAGLGWGWLIAVVVFATPVGAAFALFWYPGLVVTAGLGLVAALTYVTRAILQDARRRRSNHGELPRPVRTAARRVADAMLIALAALAVASWSTMTVCSARAISGTGEVMALAVYPFIARLTVGALLVLLAGLVWPSHLRNSEARFAAARFLAVSGCFTLYLALAMPVHRHELDPARKGICLSTAKKLSMALNMYATDNAGRLPPSATWQEALLHYTENTDVFQCPEAPEAKSAYAYNAALSTAVYSALADPSRVVGIFESDAGWDASGGPELLPTRPRHLGGDNYAFPDGHAQWLSCKRLPDGSLTKEPHADWVRWKP